VGAAKDIQRLHGHGRRGDTVRNIEDAIFDEFLPVNGLAMVERLKELMKELETTSLAHARYDHRVRKLMWLIINNYMEGNDYNIYNEWLQLMEIEKRRSMDRQPTMDVHEPPERPNGLPAHRCCTRCSNRENYPHCTKTCIAWFVEERLDKMERDENVALTTSQNGDETAPAESGENGTWGARNMPQEV